jgi:hypothetical protein
MFDLEKSIQEWRQRMTAAGIQSTALLEELEGHLREEIGRLTKMEVEDSEAFRLGVESVGQSEMLSAEFAKTRGIHDFPWRSRMLRINLSINSLLGLIWLAGLADFLLNVRMGPLNAAGLLGWSVLAALVVGSALLTIGAKTGRFLIRTGALLFLANAIFSTCLFAYMESQNLAHRGSTWKILAEHWGLIAFMVITILVLHMPERMNLKTTVKI